MTQFSTVINAWGTATKYGISRSPKPVVDAVAEALGNYYDMDELFEAAGQALSKQFGTQWGCITHCTAAAVTLSVAATMTAGHPSHVERLPNTTGLPRHKIVIPTGHRVFYGGDVVQAVALSGARVEQVGSINRCSMEALQAALETPDCAALLYVESHLAARQGVAPLAQVAALAKKCGVPIIVDAAAQDLRAREIIAADPDLALFSCQKYLAGPTAGLVVGRRHWVDAVSWQHSGIGRTMRPSKEAILGSLAALSWRERLGLAAWEQEGSVKTQRVADRLSQLPQLQVSLVPDPTGCPLQRVRIQPVHGVAVLDAVQLANRLANYEPKIAVGAHYATLGYLNLEVVGLHHDEIDVLVAAITSLVTGT